MRPAAVAALATGALLVTACGEDSSSSATTPTATAPAIALLVRFNDSTSVSSGRLICRAGEERTTGELARGTAAEERCRGARSLVHLLTANAPQRRACTQIYGGPETVVVTGTVDGRTIDRRFSRTNGCEIRDYAQLKPILP